MLLYPQGLDFISAFFATLYAGAVAVPAPHAQGTRAALARITSIIEDARPLIVLTTDALRGETAAILAQLQAGLTVCTLEDLMQSANPTAQGKLPAPESLALLQYTSGHFLRFSGPEAKRGGLMEEVVRLI